MLGGRHRIEYDMDKDMVWRWDQVLKIHPNGMRFSVFGEDGDLLATNEYFRYVRCGIASLLSICHGDLNHNTKNQCGWWLCCQRENERWACRSSCRYSWPLEAYLGELVDENLFYKGVDKSVVHGARLHQPSHTDSDGMEETQAADSNQPPYPFVVRDFHSIGVKWTPTLELTFLPYISMCYNAIVGTVGRQPSDVDEEA